MQSVIEALTSLQKMSSANKKAAEQQLASTATGTEQTTVSRPEPVAESPKLDEAKSEPPRYAEFVF
jgi:hypothetical protein